MAYIPNTIYHIYNQGNNHQNIFLQKKNYIFFLHKMRKHLLPHVDVLAYCLMPNHFHFLVYTRAQACETARNPRTGSTIHNHQVLSRSLGVLLSSYTRAINKQEGRSGALFRGNTNHKKCFYEGMATLDKAEDLEYATNYFAYIHNNPVKAKLVENSIDWDFSSARDYAQLRQGTLCNQVLARQLGLPVDNHLQDGNRLRQSKIVRKLLI